MGGKKGGNKSGGGTKKKKTLKTIKAERAAKEAARRKVMQDKARIRNQTFKDTGFQSKGGRYAQVTDPVTGKVRTVDVRKQAMQDAAKARIQAKNTVPDGSFGISEAGRAQAEKNKAIKAAEDSTFNPVNFNFDSDSALNYARGFNTLSVANTLAPKGGLSSYYMSGSKPHLNFNQAMRLENQMHQQSGKFNPSSRFNLSMYARGESNPFRGMPGYGTAKSLINPRIRDINLKRMYAGKPPLSMDKINPGGFQTAPTEGFRRIAPIAGAFLPGFNIGSKIFNEGRADSATTKAINSIDNINVGGLSIGFNSPESTDIGARAGRFFTSLPGKVANLFSGEANAAETTAGGLNIGTTTKTGESGETTGGKLGRTLFNAAFPAAGVMDFLSNDRTDLDMRGDLKLPGTDLKIQPYSVVKDVATVLKKPIKNLSLLNEGYQDYQKIKESDNKVKSFFKNVDAKQFFDSAELVNQSNVAQDVGESAGLPSNFKSLAGDTYTGLKENLSGYEQGRKFNRIIMNNRVDEINNLLKTINEQPKLKTLSKFLATYESEDDKIKNLSHFDKVKYAMNTEDAPPVKALSMTDRGITGAAGNLLIGGRLSDIYNQATGNFEGGVNAGIPKGQVGVSDADLFNIASLGSANASVRCCSLIS